MGEGFSVTVLIGRSCGSRYLAGQLGGGALASAGRPCP